MEEILIINTGGTISKKYNPKTGELEVPKDSLALEGVLKYFYNLKYKIKNIIHKDSLDMNDADRLKLSTIIENANQNKILIIHGTDTMDKTAQFLEKRVKDKCIILTGAMVPFSINAVEATANISTAIGYLLECTKTGVYISMHGLVDIHNKIYKNREIGVFQKR